MQTESQRIPPQAPDAERKILGSMLLEPEAASVALAELRAENFYRPEHQTIFNEIRIIYEEGRNPDALMVESSLSAKGKLADIGGFEYLMDLGNSVSSSANVGFFTQIVKEMALKREIIKRFTDSINQAYDGKSDVGDLLKSAENFIYGSLTDGSSQRIQTIAEILAESISEMETIQEGGGGIVGLESGLPVDKILSGYQKQKTYVIAARPGMGKTAYMLQIIKSFAQNGSRPGVLSLEMGNRSLGNRLIMADAGVDGQRARTGRLTDEEMDRCRASAAELSELNIVIDDSTHLTPALLRVKARMMKQQYKIGALALDYLQLMHSDDTRQNREQEVSEVSRTCKLIAKDLDIPVIILAQLSRKPEDRGGFGKRPQNGDLRESGAIEQDADVVQMLFRPDEYGLETYPDGSSTENICEVIVTKHRDGPLGLEKLLFHKETMTFKPLQYRPAPTPASSWYESSSEPETDLSPF